LCASALLLPPFSVWELTVLSEAVSYVTIESNGILMIGDLVNLVAYIGQPMSFEEAESDCGSTLLRKVSSLSYAEEVALYTILDTINLTFLKDRRGAAEAYLRLVEAGDFRN